MARPQTKGSVIGIRLPLDVDAEVRRRAATAGMSAAEWLIARLVSSVRATLTNPPTHPVNGKREVDNRLKR